MTRAPMLAALVSLLAAPALAQRPVDPVAELSDGALFGLVSGQRYAIERCAAQEDTGAYVAEVRARVRPGPAPSTMYNARIQIDVRSRPRDASLEGCARRAIADALRHTAYAVPRGASARQTFRIADRADPPPRRAPPPITEADARRALDGWRTTLQRCLEIAGVPERVTLRVTVEANGRLVLTNADLPPGASRHALPCLAHEVSRIPLGGRPARRFPIVYALAVRGHAR